MTDTASSAGGNTRDITTVNISDIVLRPDFQVRNKLDPGIIKRYSTAYKQTPQDMPPLKVAKIGKALVLVDGWHRLEALKDNDLELAEVEVVRCKTERDALWLAASANLSHGLPLKRGELKPVFHAYIKAMRHKPHPYTFKSYREIAADLGGIVSHVTIMHWMKRHYPSIAQRMGWKDKPPHGDGCPAKRMRTMKDETREHLDMALAAFRGVESLEDRLELLNEAEKVIQEMRQEEVRDVPRYDLDDF